jgi:hypothetical protein
MHKGGSEISSLIDVKENSGNASAIIESPGATAAPDMIIRDDSDNTAALKRIDW